MDFMVRSFTFTEAATADWFVVVLSMLVDYSACCSDSIDSIKSKEVVK